MIFARSTGRLYYVPGKDDAALMRYDPKLGGTPVRAEAPPPLLGQHTEEVLREVLGCDAGRIAGLRAQEVI